MAAAFVLSEQATAVKRRIDELSSYRSWLGILDWGVPVEVKDEDYRRYLADVISVREQLLATPEYAGHVNPLLEGREAPLRGVSGDGPGSYQHHAPRYLGFAASSFERLDNAFDRQIILGYIQTTIDHLTRYLNVLDGIPEAIPED